MKTLRDLAAELGREFTGVRRRAMQHGIPMSKAINPRTNQTVLVLDAAAERQLKALYPKRLILQSAETEGALS